MASNDHRPHWRDVQPRDFYEYAEFSMLQEIRLEATHLVSAFQARLEERRQQPLPADPDDAGEEFADREYFPARVRLLRGGFFLVAFSYFEFEILGLCARVAPDSESRRGGAYEALREVLKPVAASAVADWDVMQQRVKQLQDLRNELAHGGGLARQTRPDTIRALEQSGDLLVESDWAGDVLVLNDGTLEHLICDLEIVLRVCRHVAENEPFHVDG